MPESLAKKYRSATLSLKQINPFQQLLLVFSVPSIKWLLIPGFLVWLPNGSFQAIFAQFSIDTFSLKPVIIGFTFSLIGLMDIFSQLLIMPVLLRYWRDQKILTLGITSEILGYIMIILAAFYGNLILFIVGMLFFGFGDSLFGPAFNGLLSKQVSQREQGKIQGASQSIQAFAKVIGPIIGGQLYVIYHHTTPVIAGVILLVLAMLSLNHKNGSYL